MAPEYARTLAPVAAKKAQARSPRFAWDGPKSLQIFAIMR
jgi:hypothetical protein